MSESKPVNSTREGHEKTDINIRKVAVYGVALLLIICFAGIVTTVLVFKKLAGDNARESVSTSPMLETQPLPPEPRLQASAPLDLKKYRAEEDAQLGSYGWVDKPNGVVRIPIDRALQLVLERGLPVRPGARIEAPVTPDSATPQAKPKADAGPAAERR